MNTKLDNWEIVRSNGTPYRSQARGIVSGHPSKPDGKWIRTSLIENISLNEKILVTQSRVYELGTPNIQWTEWLKKNNYTLEDFAEAIQENNRLRNGEEEI